MTELPKGKILVIDNDEHVLLTFKRVLSTAGYKIFTATKGREALKIAKENQPHIIMLDNSLPDMTGMEVLKKSKHNLKSRTVLW